MTNGTHQVGETKALDDTWITAEELLAAVEADACIGFCVACGTEHYGVEPDARNLPCQECGNCKVYGAEDLLIRLV